MLLAIDIGNSTLGLGLFPKPERAVPAAVRKIPTRPIRSSAGYKEIISGFLPRNAVQAPGGVDAVISSVVPAANKAIIGALRDLFGKKPLMVSHRLETGLAFGVRRPEKVGPDRIANAAAGCRSAGGPVAIVDFGTATTITVVGEKNMFLGGAIMPGLQLMAKALSAGTASLPAVHIKACADALGKDTASAIRSGIVNGAAKAVEGLLKDMEKGLGFKLKLILTGGHAGLMSPLFKRKHKVVPELTFQGMRLIYLKAQIRNR